ncbi:hypothetical protein B0H14DRAFT_2348869 [Mycena olivaceomarginata]|nr:hypothetical protein B0H14DRAFT_2348869 [Mycena olivaceomarginata]
MCKMLTKSSSRGKEGTLWRHSSQYNALGQMLLTNQCLDKLAATYADFGKC